MKTLCSVVFTGFIAWMFLFAQGVSGQIAFYQHILTNEITNGIDTWVADMNGDGFMDLLSASLSNGGEITYWENDGFQHFTAFPVTTDFEWVRSVRAGDIDGDMKPDIVACAWAANTIKWWKNMGDATFNEYLVDTTFIGAHTVDIKDVNGDGYMDILCSSFDNSPAFSEIAWWENLQNTGWEKHLISAIFQQSTFIYGEDMDNDMDLDIIACCEALGDIYWWENTGSESFEAHLIDNQIPKIHTIVARDLDLDNDMDILAAACMSSLIAWYENTDGQQFVRHDLGTFGGALWLDAADMDNDGDQDLVGAGQSTSKLAWWENTNMQFTKHDVEGAFSGAFCLTLANMDNDTDTDIVAAAYNTNKISWFENLVDRANLFNGPESVVYDAANFRYLISNWNTGSIIKTNPVGQNTYLNTDLFHSAGLHLSENILYAASNQGTTHGLAVIQPYGGNIIHIYQIPGIQSLKDITSDTSGNLYISDPESNKIFKVVKSSYASWVFCESPLLQQPNSIHYDIANDRLIVMNGTGPGGEILAVELADSSANILVSTNKLQTKGITMDQQGNVYFSCWETNSVYRYDPGFTDPPQLISSGHSGPADIFFNQQDNILAIPNFTGNSIDFVQVNITSADPHQGTGIGDFQLNRIYPNPFSERTAISYSLNKDCHLRLSIYTITGQQVKILQDGFQLKGNHVLEWDGSGEHAIKCRPGIYLAEMESGGTTLFYKILQTN